MLSATPVAVLADSADTDNLLDPAESFAQLDQPFASSEGSDPSHEGFRLASTDWTNDSEQERSKTVLRRELVFVDVGAEDYQQLVDDLLANGNTTRKFEVYLLDAAREDRKSVV